MANSTTNGRERNLPKGLLAGLIGGMVGAGVILLAEEIFPPRAEGEPSPLAILAGGGASAPAGIAPSGYQAIHYAVGAVAGGIYGLATEVEPSLAAWRGAAFGITLHRLTHASLLPRMGIPPSKEEPSPQARLSGWISHAAYGIATDSVRRVLRRML